MWHADHALSCARENRVANEVSSAYKRPMPILRAVPLLVLLLVASQVFSVWDFCNAHGVSCAHERQPPMLGALPVAVVSLVFYTVGVPVPVKSPLPNALHVLLAAAV